MRYADIIVDISSEELDRTYQYRIPEEFEEKAVAGAPVLISFGRGGRMIKGYIVGLSDHPKIDPEKIKPIAAVEDKGLVIESQLITLAYWIKEHYGASMNEALHTVIPVKRSVKQLESRRVEAACSRERLLAEREEAGRKRYTAREKLLDAVIETGGFEFADLKKRNLSPAAVKPLVEKGILRLRSEGTYRNPLPKELVKKEPHRLNPAQRAAADQILADFSSGVRKTCLLHGVTGSGKTEVYMEVIAGVVKAGYQVIMLIPEIALTYQTVMRFYSRFGDRIAVMNSRLSAGERYDQSVKAKEGLIDIMIGPRSALFTPFKRLGLIIMDEEHEGSYKSEMPPKYHARETAIERARLGGAFVLLGSATPSVESYCKAQKGEYTLYTLPDRAGAGTVPQVWVEDLREELKKKNKSIFGERLKNLIGDRLRKKEQIMLFINRRGYAGFVSCRSCGHVMKCPHCDISLTAHNDGTLVCHYCGHRQIQPKLCPVCTSPYIAAFGLGTQKVETLVKKEFPEARVLRMDADTTRTKGGHEKIVKAFADGEADILIGTQMIVKGHDFERVTLVGILAADLSLYASDYRAAERTFELLLQAAGRAGRGDRPGDVVIQTYHPEHYSVTAAAAGSYEAFYEQEMAYRGMLLYPPAAHILVVLVCAKDEEKAAAAAELLKTAAEHGEEKREEPVIFIGPAPASLAKANDIYRQVLYMKHVSYERLMSVKDGMEEFLEKEPAFAGVGIQFDFDPMNGY